VWCDTGPFCGNKYQPADRGYTSRTCCYDTCVDGGGETIRPNSAWHQESKRIVAKATAQGGKTKTKASAKSSSSSSSGTNKNRQGTKVPTSKGCSCNTPFTFGGVTHNNCTDYGAPVLDKDGKPSLWCDTGPKCGNPYHKADAQFTSRKCCYDVCVDTRGATIRPRSAWHDESKKYKN
jgi:hypothetical protein